MLKVAIQGEKASFHDLALLKFFNYPVEILPCDTFLKVFQTIDKGSVNFAVVAIENSLYGSINETYDLLDKYSFNIIGEVYLRVEQCLIGLRTTKLSDIKEVYSHPVALAQCDEYIENNLNNIERIETHDTAGSVALIKKFNDKTKVAIASQEAAKLYEMPIIAKSIETNKQNFTRFIVLSKTKQEVKNANKTSLKMSTTNKPGALYKALGSFANRDINLSKLQSRPIIGKAWHYLFYLDIDCGENDPRFEAAYEDLKANKNNITILGSYISAVNS